MNRTDAPPTPADVIRMLRKHPRRWLVPTILVTLLAVVFTVLWPRSWVATQGLIVRNEATDTPQETPGKFRFDNELKVAQETILEVARSRGVLKAALAEVGPPDDYRPKKGHPFPSPQDVADLHDAVTLIPPKGAEFGTTEVFYLEVKDPSRARTLALAEVICDRLEDRLQAIREAKAESMIAELDNAASIAQQDLARSARRLRDIEAKVGGDLVELRILHRAASDSSDLRRTMVEVAAEQRQNEMRRREDQELLQLLKQAQNDPDHLLAVPNTLLVSQPALKQLKEGLVDAQLRLSQLQGRLTDAHPRVRAALNSVNEIERHMQNEIDVAIRGVESGLRMTDSRAELLQKRMDDLHRRLDLLVSLRVDYSNQVADVEHLTRLLEEAQTQLMNARADLVGSGTASLLSRIDTPNTGTKPAGPGHAMIVLAGVVGGLIIGLGLLVLTAPSAGYRLGAADTAEQAEPTVAAARESNGRDNQHVTSLVDQAV